MPERIQREVDELLAQLVQFPPKKTFSRRVGDAVLAPFRAVAGVFSGARVPSVSTGHILLAAIIIIVVAYVAGGDGAVWNYIIAAGILLFILAFIMSLRRQSGPGGTGTTKYWRDRPLDLKSGGTSTSQRSWWDRWRNRR